MILHKKVPTARSRRRLAFEGLDRRRTPAVAIDVGHHFLIEDTPGQFVDVLVSSDEDDPPVSDFLLRAQIGDSTVDADRPVFQCSRPECDVNRVAVDARAWFLGSGQIWDAEETVVIGGPLLDEPPDAPDGFAHLAQASASIAPPTGTTVRAAGFLLRMEIDTTGIAAGRRFDLRLSDTLLGEDSYFLTTGPVPVETTIVNGEIEIVPAAPPTVLAVTMNADRVDPADLPQAAQPSDWATQRSDLASLQVTFDMPVRVTVDDLVLTNLGVDAPTEPDRVIALTDEQISVVGNVLTIEFPPDTPMDLEDGVFRLELLPGIVNAAGTPLDGDGDGIPGDSLVHQGNSTNRFYQLLGDVSGDQGVSIFDFSTFAYWFGQSVPRAPAYVDFSLDDGISIFDFTLFAGNFGASVVYPVPLTTSGGDPPIRSESSDGDHERNVDSRDLGDVAWRRMLWDWSARSACRAPVLAECSSTTSS